MSGFNIGPRRVGDGAPCLIVAEVAQAHEGSVSLAHAYIDAIADAGADAAKFQCHLGDDTDRWRVEPKYRQDENRQAYWMRTGFDASQWTEIKEHCDSRGLLFLCSPFSVEAVKLLDPLVETWKVASGEINNGLLLASMTMPGKAKPLIISTGMARQREIEQATMYARAGVALLQCTSEYPTPADRIGLRLMKRLDAYAGSQFGCPVGLSDHSGTIYPSLAAVTLGASIVEVHVKLSAHDQGFDAASSITIEDLAQLVEGVRFIEKAMQPVDKDAMAKELAPMREVFMQAGDVATFGEGLPGFVPGVEYRLE